MKRRIILIVVVVGVLGLIGAGIWYYVRQNTGWRRLARITVALQAKKYDRALELADAYVTSYPDNWRGYYYRGRAHIGQGAYGEARKALTQARELGPLEVDVTVWLARTHSFPAQELLKSLDDVSRLKGAAEALGEANAVLDAWLAAAAEREAVPQEGRLDVLQQKGVNLNTLAKTHRQIAKLSVDEAKIDEAAEKTAAALRKRQEAGAARGEARENEVKAMAVLEQVITAAPARDRAGVTGVRIGETHLDARDLSRAGKEEEKRQDPKELERIRKEKEEILAHISRKEGFRARIRQAIETLDPKDRPPMAAVALVEHDSREIAKDPSGKGMREKLEQMAVVLDALIEKTPDDHADWPILVTVRAEVALMRNKPERALELCAEVIEKRKSSQLRARLCRARALMMQGHVRQAERELFVLKASPRSSVRVLYAYASAAWRAGKRDEAGQALRKIVEEFDPGHAPSLKVLAEHLISRGFHSQALSDVQALYEAHPDDPEAVRLMVQVLFHTKQLEAARKVLEAAERDYPERADVLIAVADGWGTLGDRERATAATHRAAEVIPATVGELRPVFLALIRDARAPEAERTLYDWRAKYPNHPVIHFLLGYLFEATGRRHQAVEQYGRAAALDEANESYKVAQASALVGVGDLTGAEEVLQQVWRPNERAEKLRRTIRLRKAGVAGDSKLYGTELASLVAAQSYLSAGQPDRCIQICLAELKKNADEVNVDARRLLGRAYLVQGKSAECLREWTEVLKAEPLSPFAYRSIARVRIRTETPEEVEAALRGIPGANRTLVDLTMGWLHDGRRDFETAATFYANVAGPQGATEHEDLRNGARVLWAKSLANAGKTDEALKTLEKLTGPPVWQRRALWNKAGVLVTARRFDDADSVLTKLRDDARQAKDTSLLRDVVSLYERMKRDDKAIEVCDEILRLLPKHAWPYSLKGAVLERAGKLDATVEWYRSAIERQPGNLANYLTLARIMDLRQDSLQALAVLQELEDGRGEAGRGAALSGRGDLFVRWGLPSEAVRCYEERSKLARGGAPRIKLALGIAFGRLGRKTRARRMLQGVPKYSREYVAARQLVAELADTAEEKLAILYGLSAERPGHAGVFLRKLRILFGDGRHAEVVRAYRRFVGKYGEHGVVPAEASFIALRSHLNEAADRKRALELSVRMAERLPRSNWRYVAILLYLPEEPGKAAKMLPTVSEAGVFDALLGLIAAHQTGGDTKPWAERVRAINRELTKGQPSRSIPLSYRILAAVVNGATGQAKAELAQVTSASIAELVSFAENDPARSAAEAVKLLRATVALELRLPTLARTLALDILTTRPECQWAAALAVGTAPDAATRRKILAMLRPKDCVTAKMILAGLALEEKDFAKTAEIYRSVAEVEKENLEALRRLALAESLVGNLEKALTIQRKIWQTFQDPVAANDAAYLTAHLWPRDQKKLDEARRLIGMLREL